MNNKLIFETDTSIYSLQKIFSSLSCIHKCTYTYKTNVHSHSPAYRSINVVVVEYKFMQYIPRPWRIAVGVAYRGRGGGELNHRYFVLILLGFLSSSWFASFSEYHISTYTVNLLQKAALWFLALCVHSVQLCSMLAIFGWDFIRDT